MSADFLTLLLAPLTVGVLLLYLQQIRESHRLRAERKAALDELAKAKSQIARDADQYRETLRAAKEYYEAAVQRREKDVRSAHVLIELQKIQLQLSEMDSDRSSDIIPGADAGS